MRERRLLSGSSNKTPRPVSAGCESGVSSSATTGSSSNGSLTARRAGQDELEKRPSTGIRRIQTARSERPASSSAGPCPPPAITMSRPVEPSALPLLHVTPQVQWAVHVTPSIKPETSSIRPVLQEFTALLRDRYDGKRSLRLAFLNWDRNKDGRLSTQEIRDMIHSLGLTKKLGHHSVDAIVDHVASLPSQSLTYDDFCGYVYGVQNTKAMVNTSSCSDPAVQSVQSIQVGLGVQKPLVESQPAEDDVVLSSDRALYATADRVTNLLRKKYESRQLRHVFRHWDADKDGGITQKELDQNLRRQGIKLPQNQLQELFDKHDTNKNGKLMYQEFVDMIYGPIHPEHHNPVLQAHLQEAAKRENQPLDPYLILKNSALENPVRRVDVRSSSGFTMY